MKKNKLTVGDLVPEFKLKDQDDNWFVFSHSDAKKRVIYFYPKDNTKVCTAQACSFRDWQDDFLAKGYEVIGISNDSSSSHLKFKAKHNLNFTLLSDTGGKVRKRFGANSFLGLIPSRVTYVIDEQGRIVFEHEAMFEGEEHILKVRAFIDAL